MDLTNIRFLSTFVCFCVFFLLHEIVCYVFFHLYYVGIHINQIVTYWTKVLQKKFLFVKRSSIRLYFEISLSVENIFNKIFINMYGSSLHSAEHGLIKMQMKKCIRFHGEAETDTV